MNYTIETEAKLLLSGSPDHYYHHQHDRSYHKIEWHRMGKVNTVIRGPLKGWSELVDLITNYVGFTE
jgi:hypothetical protein